MDILYEAVIHLLLLSLHLKCLLIVFPSRSWWHAVSSIFTLVIRFLGGLDDEVAKKLICAGLRWYDGIHSSYLSEYQLYLKGFSYHFWGEWLLPFISFLINYIELRGLFIKIHTLFSIQIVQVDNRYWTIFLIYMYTRHKM